MLLHLNEHITLHQHTKKLQRTWEAMQNFIGFIQAGDILILKNISFLRCLLSPVRNLIYDFRTHRFIPLLML